MRPKLEEEDMWVNGHKKDGPDDEENFTFLGRGVNFKGVVSFDGTVRIDGRLEGEIHTKGTLMVGEHAVLKGIITAGTLISGGKINGTITALEKVQLLKSGVLIGEVHAPSFSMEEGAHFQGICDMGAPKLVEEPHVPAELENMHDFAAQESLVEAQDLPD